MHLTAFTDFALRALMRLAGDPERTFTTEEIASSFGISRHHLTKIVGSLASAGFVATQRGAGGGFRLARPPEEITLGEIVRVLEARFPLVECFRTDGGACVLTPRCGLKFRLAAAREAFLSELDRTALAECAYPVPTKSAESGGTVVPLGEAGQKRDRPAGAAPRSVARLRRAKSAHT